MGIFSSPAPAPAPYVPPMQAPALPPAPAEPPKPVDQAASDAAAQTKARLAAAGGYGSTLLTGGQGVTSEAKIQRKTLLGQ